MSIGLGNIIVQNKKEPAGVSEAESGLHMDGSKARLGGMLLENTDIDIDTKTFFLQWDGGAGAFLIDVFDDKYFFGTIDGSFNLETGFIFKENEAAVKLNGNAAVSARGQAGVGAGIVYEFGDVESVNNGTKITIKDDTETVEITNVPNVDTTNLAPLFLSGNRVVKGTNANVDWQAFTPTTYDEDNINSPVFTSAKFCIINSTGFYEIELTFKITDTMHNFFFIGIDISDIQTITGLTISADKFFPNSTYFANITPRPITNYEGYGDGYTGFVLNYWCNTQIGSYSGGYNFLRINGMFKITNV